MEKEFERLNLNPFLGISKFADSHDIVEGTKETIRNLGNVSTYNIQKGDTIRKYEIWFQQFQEQVLLIQPTKFEMVKLLKTALGVKNQIVDLVEILRNPEITHMLDMKIKIARYLFGSDKLNLVYHLFALMSPINCTTLEEFVEMLLLDCNVYITTCLVFNERNFLTEKHLVDMIKFKLPFKIRQTMQPNWIQIDELKLLMEGIYLQMRATHNSQLDEYFVPGIKAVKISDEEEEKPLLAKKICPCCGAEGHLKKNCYFRNKRCKNCHKIGHTQNVCRNIVIRNKTGKEKGLVHYNRYKTTFEVNQNETNPQKLDELASWLQRQRELVERNRNLARNRYQKKKRDFQEIKSYDENNLKVNRIDTSNVSDKEKELIPEIQPNESFEPKVSRIIISNESQDLNKLPELDQTVEINGIPVLVCFDSGADVCLMSTRSASELGLQIDKTKAPITFKAVYIKVTAPVSERVIIGYRGTNKEVITSFLIVKENSKMILISRKVMEALGIRLTIMDLPIVNRVDFISESFPEIIDSDDKIIDRFINESCLKLDIDKGKLRELLVAYTCLWKYEILGKSPHKISFRVNGWPIKSKVRPLSKEMLKELNSQLNEMLETKVIEKVDDAKWISPIVLVKKKDNSYRLTIDYRRLNKNILDDPYPLPHMKNLLKNLQGSNWFSKIDLKNGFWNIGLEETSKEYTGFIAPNRGTFIFNVLPYGLKTSPTQFQKIMENLFREFILKNVMMIYIDDLIIYTHNKNEHYKILEEVFNLLKDNKLGINTNKTEFFKNSITYLGQVVNSEGIRPDMDRIKPLIESEVPKTKKQLRSFLGAVNFYRNYIKDLAKLTADLTILLKKHQKFIWTDYHTKLVNEIKERMIQITLLAFPDSSKPFVIMTDASEKAVGAALAQKDEKNDSYRFIHFTSRILNETQRKWSTIEKELFAIVIACNTFDYYIQGSKVIVLTDCKSITGIDEIHSGKLYRWKLRLSEFNLEIKHINGEQNELADWLSRNVQEEEGDFPPYAFIGQVKEILPETDSFYEIPSIEEIVEEALREKDNWPIEVVYVDEIPKHNRSGKLYIPEKYRPHILYWFHSGSIAGHSGMNKTLKKITRYFWWPNVSKDVEEYIHKCLVCQVMRNRKFIPKRDNSLSKPRLFQLVSLDVMGPINWKFQSYYIHVAIDHYSRFMITDVFDKPLTSKDAIRILKDKWIPIFACPLSILTDRGTIYISSEFHNYVTNELRIDLYHTSPYYPQGNGINESAHKSLSYILKTFDPEKELPFSEIVNQATLIYNSTPHGSIGDTPFFHMLGIDAILPGFSKLIPENMYDLRIIMLNERWNNIVNNLEENSQPLQTQIDNIKEGDIISYELSEQERKMYKHHSGNLQYSPNWSFPHRVTKVLEKNITVIPIYYEGKPRLIPKSKIKWLGDKNVKLHELELKKLIQVPKMFKGKELISMVSEKDLNEDTVVIPCINHITFP